MVVGVVETTFRRIIVGKTAGLIINIIIVSKELSSAFSFVLLLFKGVFEKRTRFAKKRLLKKLSTRDLSKNDLVQKETTTSTTTKKKRRKKKKKKTKKKTKKKEVVVVVQKEE